MKTIAAASALTAALLTTTLTGWSPEKSTTRPRPISDQLCATLYPVWVLNQQVTDSFTVCVPSPV